MASISGQLENYFKQAEGASVEELLNLANSITENESFFGALGNVSPVKWAEEAKTILDRLENPTGFSGFAVHQDSQGNYFAVESTDWNDAVKTANQLATQGDPEGATATKDAVLQGGQAYDEFVADQASQWLTGSKQATAASNFFETADNNFQQLQQEITNATENIANLTDFSDASAETREQVLNSSTYQEANAKLQELTGFFDSDFATQVGLEAPQVNLQQDAQGNFALSGIEGEELPTQDGVAGGTGTDLSNSTLVQQEEDGTYSIVNAESGETIQGGLENLQVALATQQQALGGTPSLAGAPDVFAIDPLASETVKPFTLPSGEQVDPRVATPEELTGQAPIQTALAPDAQPEVTPEDGTDATLVNPETGETIVVASGSQEAQAAFGQGFVLPPTGGVIPSGTATSTTAPSTTGATGMSIPDQVAGLSAPATTTPSIIPSRSDIMQDVAGEFGVDVGENVQALTTVGESIQTQETVLRDLEETILDRSKGVGITQGQLNRLVATEAEPIAQALKDLLTSRSLLNNELALVSSETASREASELSRFGLFTDLLSQQGLTIDPFTGQTVPTLAATQAEAAAERQDELDLNAFYESQGYAVNPDTGQLAPTLERQLSLEAAGLPVGAVPNTNIYSTGETSDFGLEYLTTSGGNRSDRNNNPLNIKASDYTAGFAGVLGVEQSAAADGGNFLVFDSPVSGFAAAEELWRNGSSYQGVDVNTALQRWSGGGYGADVATVAGIDPSRDAQSLSDPELQSLFEAMGQREGYTGGTIGTTEGGPISYEELSPVAKSIVDGTLSVKDITPTTREEIAHELNSIGFKSAITAQMREEVEQVVNGVDSVKEVLEDVPSSYTGFTQGRFSEWFGLQDVIPEIAAFKAQVGIVGMQLTRMFEKGRISDADREFYLSLMPNLRMNQESIEASVTNLQERLNARIGEYVNEMTSGTDSEATSNTTNDPLGLF